jgi:hypothetical protein
MLQASGQSGPILIGFYKLAKDKKRKSPDQLYGENLPLMYS